ncbi:heterokaryon incompatibility protein-domain-containing protein, partial [Leptodontidium sp. 2 PMI_412]
RPFIRLLELYPGRGNNPVEASLKEVPLSSELQYEAVSYCWGDPKDVSTIFCNGQQLPVSRRLEVALRNMRYPNTPRILWADAICINQTHNTEKENQVQLIRTIFSNAQRTLIFLGDTEE